MFTHVDHVGLAVRDLEAAIALYSSCFGVSSWERILMPDRHMEVAVSHIGQTLIELIAPTSAEAAFAKFLDDRGPGMHHMAYRVVDIAQALEQLQQQGISLIDEQPRPGLHNTLVAFLHPKSTLGVLIELVQHTTATQHV
ncbi:MAG: methylmalonyl-CoA epimerase [Roseiflexaceae bacterium]|nr:methylmalonyl-CoA epimerase [Roseiflexaceae bacterium]